MTQKKKKLRPASRDILLETLKTRAKGGLKRVPVEIEEWDMIVFIQEFNGTQQAAIAELTAGETPNMEALCKMLTMALVDEEGNPLLTLEHVDLLMGDSAQLVVKLIQKVGDLNKVDVSALEKN